MLSKKLQDALNEQIRNELDSSYLYLSMAAWCEAQNLKGAAHWMQAQVQEENGHAMRLFGFIHDRGGRVTLQALAKPEAEFKSLAQVFEATLAHEQKITTQINRLYDLALKENDYATQAALQWFITEQVEEEKVASEILGQLKKIGDNFGALMFLDHHLGQRK